MTDKRFKFLFSQYVAAAYVYSNFHIDEYEIFSSDEFITLRVSMNGNKLDRRVTRQINSLINKNKILKVYYSIDNDKNKYLMIRYKCSKNEMSEIGNLLY